MKISKILFLSSALTVFSAIGYGDCPPPSASIPAPVQAIGSQMTNAAEQFTGLSLGVNGGFMHVAADTTYSYYFYKPFTNQGGRNTTTANGGYAGLHAIYGHVSPSQFYLGGEITCAYNFVHGTSRDSAVSGKYFRYSLRDGYTAAVRAGYLAGQALVYAKGGVAFTRRNAESQFDLSDLANSLCKTSKYKTGALVGFGFDVPIQKRVSFGLEANYVKYGSDSFAHPGAIRYTMHTDTYDFKVKLTFKM
jgi:hypothetical protein